MPIFKDCARLARASIVRIQVSVLRKSDNAPLARRVMALNESRIMVAEGKSAHNGSLVLEVSGNQNNRYYLQACGINSEGDAIASRIAGTPI